MPVSTPYLALELLFIARTNQGFIAEHISFLPLALSYLHSGGGCDALVLTLPSPCFPLFSFVVVVFKKEDAYIGGSIQEADPPATDVYLPKYITALLGIHH